jgi:hypothetical protein
MKFEITQTITQTITRVVEAKDRQHALALIEDEKFREDLEVQRMEQWETSDSEEWDVTPIEEKPNRYARKCSVTGEGMNAGWVCGADYYIKYEKDLIKHLKDVYNNECGSYELDKLTGIINEDKLREMYYESNYFFYTEWNDESEYNYVEIDGKIVGKLVKLSSKGLNK